MPPDKYPDSFFERSLRLASCDLEAIADHVSMALDDRVALLLEARPTPSPLLTQAEVAEWLNVSDRTVDNLVAAGDLVPVRVTPSGRGRRFMRSAVQAFIKSRMGGR